MVNKLFLFQGKQLYLNWNNTGFIRGAEVFWCSRAITSGKHWKGGGGGITQTPLVYQPGYHSRTGIFSVYQTDKKIILVLKNDEIKFIVFFQWEIQSGILNAKRVFSNTGFLNRLFPPVPAFYLPSQPYPPPPQLPWGCCTLSRMSPGSKTSPEFNKIVTIIWLRLLLIIRTLIFSILTM